MTGDRVVPSGGPELRVRPLQPADRDGVRALYGRLSAVSVHARFFSGSPPPEPFFDRLVQVSSRGGIGLVAESRSGVIVGEVTVEPLADGNGELAVTVDERWRGWLGPYLVARAGVEAAKRGMDGLELQVLTSNRPMRAITRARGEALLGPSDWHDVRVLIASVGRLPRWPDSPGLRVLVEQRHVSFESIAAVREAGWFGVVCAGRTTDRVPAAARCPLARDPGRTHGQVSPEADCPLASGADVAVVWMTAGPDRELLVDHHRSKGTAVVVVDPSGDDVIGTEGSRTGVVGAVREALRSRQRRRRTFTECSWEEPDQSVQTAVSAGSSPAASTGAEDTRTAPAGTGTAPGP